MREFDVVVWGATGFTGRLVAEYLLGQYGLGGELRWALGGRNQSKLESVRATLCLNAGVSPEALPLLLGDGDDAASLAGLAGRTRVVCSSVGPYAIHGGKLVAACASSGTHYCDLAGEIHWMRRMIDAHQKEAHESGARIVHSCGFDCIPSDLGTFFMQREMRKRHAVACSRVAGRVAKFRGGTSGGTIASMLNMLEEAGRDPEVRRIMADPYALNPAGERGGPDGPILSRPTYDPTFEQWTAPFVMAAINEPVVRRSNALLDFAYGRDFRYDEAVLMGAGAVGFAKASTTTAALGAAMGAMAVGPLRHALARFLPAPGTGPSQHVREAGFFDLRFLGEHPTDPGKNLRGRVTGDRDPGYGSTAKMLGESAVCLAKDELAVGGGFWTPASAMGAPLLDRLQASAGLAFAITG